ncbi:DSBA oxidoreductase [Sulfurifustis variabilis]|uniref:Thiol:disulfide interchange protein n=1 Tax=Sulfurifustis variabilis TaxID=1675686 RepID=A0A1B4V5U9_9GAMM|nr:thiol:disulfide interchange protein DsbA/DsbL [Sulfurifustis variabilis]BAU46614.1 DSBA oxidoreductase [Sulfurifustis variabilis]
MKRLLALTVSLLVLAPVLAFGGFEEGRHYAEVPFPQPVETGKQIEVREFFWYGCPHCYTLEPALNRWLSRKPANVAFVRTPGTAQRWLTHAQAFYAFEALGVTERLHPAFFEAVQRGKPRLDDEQSLVQFVKEHGVDPAKFREAFASFGVRLNVEKAKRLNEAYGINSVPTITVDGKYVTSPSLAGGEEAVFKVIEFLVQKAARERASARGSARP